MIIFKHINAITDIIIYKRRIEQVDKFKFLSRMLDNKGFESGNGNALPHRKRKNRALLRIKKTY